MKYAANVDKMFQILEDKGISAYKLAQLCKMKPTTIYSYRNGDTHMGEKTCRAIADVLGIPADELFPDMVEKAGTAEPVEVTSGVDEGGKRCRLASSDMIVGCQTMVPEDGKTLCVKSVIAMDGVEYNGYTLGDNDHICIKTGVSTKNLDLDKVLIRMKPMLAQKSHLLVAALGRSIDHELVIDVHSHGSKTVLNRGVPVAEIVFLS